MNFFNGLKRYIFSRLFRNSAEYSDVVEQLQILKEINTRLVTIESGLDNLCKTTPFNYSNMVRGMEKSMACTRINSNTFGEYKNKFAGRSVVVCATGSTLNFYQPIENAVHIGVNRAFLYKLVSFDFLFAQCWDAISHCKRELMEYKGNDCEKFFGIEGVICNNGEFTYFGIPESYANSCNAKRYATDFFTRGERSFDWTVDLCSQSISTGWSSALPAIQFALYTNPEKLYIVGCDTSAPGHFTEETCEDEYVERTARIYMSEVAKMKDNFISMKSFATAMYPDVEIISINPIGLKGLFKDKYTESYLAKNPDINTI